MKIVARWCLFDDDGSSLMMSEYWIDVMTVMDEDDRCSEDEEEDEEEDEDEDEDECEKNEDEEGGLCVRTRVCVCVYVYMYAMLCSTI